MSNKLNEILSEIKRADYATDTGRKLHAKMQKIKSGDTESRGNDELIAKITKNPQLMKFFTPTSRTEVPIAGNINGKFISRRIDRLVIDDATKNIYVLDYKSDTDKTAYRDKYAAQIREYIALLRDAYPDYTVRGYILWLQDFELVEIS